jgi:hypothetical protein
MRSYDPTSTYDQKTLAELKADPWMVNCLLMNPEAVWWGPGEDSMGSHNSYTYKNLAESGQGSWDDLNELVNFYFEVDREHVPCALCAGSGYGPEAKEISEAFYDFKRDGTKWCDKITLDEAQYLVSEGRLQHWVQGQGWTPPKVDEAFVELVNHVNGGPRPRSGQVLVNKQGEEVFEAHTLHSHDAINRCLLIEARCKRLGYELHCSGCSGNGKFYTEDKAHLGLVLWVLHPRKGRSVGIRINRIEESELPVVQEMLRRGAERNADRFGKVPGSDLNPGAVRGRATKLAQHIGKKQGLGPYQDTHLVEPAVELLTRGVPEEATLRVLTATLEASTFGPPESVEEDVDEEVLVEVDARVGAITVTKKGHRYTVANNGVARHVSGNPEDIIRALGHYLQS